MSRPRSPKVLRYFRISSKSSYALDVISGRVSEKLSRKVDADFIIEQITESILDGRLAIKMLLPEDLKKIKDEFTKFEK